MTQAAQASSLVEALREHMNVGRWVTTNELWSELRDVALRGRMAFPYRTPRALGGRITKVAEALRSRFDMRDQRGHGNIRKLSFAAAEAEPPRAAAIAMSEAVVTLVKAEKAV
jgi:hypothetical protein